MSAYVLFLVLGLGSGAVYGILALGLVLKYRSAGVVDFGHGAVAMFIAYVYLGLRGEGTLQFPWVVLPHEISLGGALATGPAIALSLVVRGGARVGHVLADLPAAARRRRRSRACARRWARCWRCRPSRCSTTARRRSRRRRSCRRSRCRSPASPSRRTGCGSPASWSCIAAILAAVYRYTRFGLATRASAENEQGAALVGLSADRIGAGNWVLATILAGIAGILIAPVSTVDPTSYTLFIVPALGVALVARFESFAVAAAAGLALGMLQSEITKLLSVFSWLPEQGLPQALPFLLIMVAMTLLGARRRRARERSASCATRRSGGPSRPVRRRPRCASPSA